MAGASVGASSVCSLEREYAHLSDGKSDVAMSEAVAIGMKKYDRFVLKDQEDQNADRVIKVTKTCAKIQCVPHKDVHGTNVDVTSPLDIGRITAMETVPVDLAQQDTCTVEIRSRTPMMLSGQADDRDARIACSNPRDNGEAIRQQVDAVWGLSLIHI